MSRPTQYFNAAVTNLGPLTTTFSAASACATQAPNWNLFSDVHNSHAPGPAFLGVNGSVCTQAAFRDCIPSGDKYDSMQRANSDQLGSYPLPYFSPGLHCPSGWETVGVASGKPSGGDLHATPKSAKGVFTKDPWPFKPANDSYGVALPEVKYYLGILGDSETLIWCCPSGFDSGIYGGCTSKIGLAKTMGVSEACNQGWSGDSGSSTLVSSFDGTTFNPPLASFTASSLTPENFTKPIPKTELNDDVAVASVVPMLALIHSDKDKSGGARAGVSVLGLVMASVAVLGLVV